MPGAVLVDALGPPRPNPTSGTLGFDVAIASWTATAAPHEYAATGATWWLEAFQPDTPLDTARRAVEQGPTPA